jgi:uncharacterized protein
MTAEDGGARAGPAAPVDRIDSIDALRGLALFGVLVINLETEFRVSIWRQFLPYRETGAGQLVARALWLFVDMKAFAVFSLLFGVGLAIQFDRLSRNPRRPVLLFRRLVALLGFGLVHLLLIWNGDILTEYAVCGLATLPLLFAPRPLIPLAAAACLLAYALMPVLPPLVPFMSPAGLAALVREAHAAYGAGGFARVLAFRLSEIPSLAVLHVDIVPRTLGLILLGAALWRTRLIQTAAAHRTPLALASAALVVAGLGLTLAGASLRSPPAHAIGAVAAPVATVVLGLGYAGLTIAACNTPAGRWLAWAEPVGRMAFTNYIAQSLVLGFIFYGYGLGLFDRLGTPAGLALAVGLFAAQAAFSRWWLARFRYGPLEWLWRALMYGRRPAFRAPARASGPVAGLAAP